MANKVSLANKYRPTGFDSLVEQDAIKTILQNQIKNNNLKHAYLFCGSAGTGKAQPLDSLILTPTGYVKMQDIAVGTKVIDGLGKTTIVTDIFPQGIKPVYKVIFNDKTFVLCSDEHLWKVGVCNNDTNQVEWSVLTVNQLLQRNIQKVANKFDNEIKYRVPLPVLNCWENKPSICIDNIHDDIPEEYLYSTIETRVNLLNGLLDVDIEEYNVIACDSQFITCNENMSNKFAFLIRSLGGIDTINIDTNNSNKTNLYKHNISLPNNICSCLSAKPFIIKDNPIREIVDIEYVGEQECQCIMVESTDHTYITDNVTVTHNTTSARIVANLMNEGKSKPIELDCASHNSVDDVRVIIDDCKSMPLDSKYKIFVLDECFTPETEILTNQGYKQFQDLNHSEKIAQYNENGSIEFVTPKRWIKQPYDGYLECWQPTKSHTIKMTPHHQQPYINSDTDELVSRFISDIEFKAEDKLLLAGNGIGSKTYLTNMDKLVLACQVCGGIVGLNGDTNSWIISLDTPDLRERFLQIAKNCDVACKEIQLYESVNKLYQLSLPSAISFDFMSYFDLNVNYSYAQEFLHELIYWKEKSENDVFYQTKLEKNIDYVSALATLCGHGAIKGGQIVNNHKYYTIQLICSNTKTCEQVQQSRTQEYYCGDVYCVEVPSHKIIVRAAGFTFITGNCHMLTVQAWNAMLKILEEPPSYVIFLFCTTDPQKIIGTIMSRVQRFNFSRISVHGITDRLLNILKNENITTFELDAVQYIARLSRGGMRDAITNLEKCLDYSNNLTLQNVLKVTSGGITEDTLLQLMLYMLNKDAKSSLLYFNQIYMSGVEVSLFLKLYTEFLQNCCKYILTNEKDITSLSDLAINWLAKNDQYQNQIANLLDGIMELNGTYASEDLKILVESWIMKECR